MKSVKSCDFDRVRSLAKIYCSQQENINTKYCAVRCAVGVHLYCYIYNFKGAVTFKGYKYYKFLKTISTGAYHSTCSALDIACTVKTDWLK